MHVRKFLPAAALAGALAASASVGLAEVRTFDIDANGAKEVTPGGVPNQGDPDGTAIGTLTLDNGTGSGSTGSATLSLNLTNLDPDSVNLTGHHIHQAPSTTNGPIVVDFGDPDTIRSGNTLSGTVTGLPAATITDVFNNTTGFYYNLHNAQFPGGAVRDQIPEPASLALLSVFGAGLLLRRRS